uniref:Uncharacterized protein n=1 Tax=Panagrolaimus sp. JU765 TaxID=591449 RepID=A0AC34QLA9_9BILA
MKLISRPQEISEQEVVDKLFFLAYQEISKNRNVLWIRNHEPQVLPSFDGKINLEDLERLQMFYADGKLMQLVVRIVTEISTDYEDAVEDVGLFIVETKNPTTKLMQGLLPILEKCENVLNEISKDAQVLVLFDMEFLSEKKVETWRKTRSYVWEEL